MESWSSPSLPVTNRVITEITLKDSITRNPYQPVKNNSLRMYVCGITPYDSAHIGHLFTYLTFDILNRVARNVGADVRYVQNVTDIDDPLFEKARLIGVPWDEISSKQIAKFKSAMEYLRIIPPDIYATVTDEIDEIIEMANSLKQMSYNIGETSYFASSFNDLAEFTRLSETELINLSRLRGGDPDDLRKRNPVDPKIWVESASDEPSWKSELGIGRPGWHIECVAIARKYLGNTFDVQGGGQDLVFPHHAFCDEINRSLFGEPLARGYLHVNLVEYQGEKMSKSLGNLVFLEDLQKMGYNADEIRIALLSQDWHSGWEFTFDMVAQAKAAFEKFKSDAANSLLPSKAQIVNLMSTLLANDLQISRLIEELFKLERIPSNENDKREVSDLLMSILGVSLIKE